MNLLKENADKIIIKKELFDMMISFMQEVAIKNEITFTKQEIAKREDLIEKLMTLEHVRAGLIIRDESPVYINQIANLQRLVQDCYSELVKSKVR